MSNDLTSFRMKLHCRVTAFVLLACAHNVFAGSFQLHEQSTTYLGTAYSGTASTAEDASTNFYNPAGLRLLKNNQVVLSGIYYYGDIKLYNATATTNVGAAVSASSTTHAASNAVIPGLHLNANINKCWSVGFSVAAPFGLNTRYASDSIARYMATKSKISTIDLTPSIAYSFNDQFSIGAGFDAMYTEATLDAAMNFGAGDGFIKNQGHAWSYGFHIGALFKPTCNLRMGLVYFSTFSPKISANVTTLSYPTTPAPTHSHATLNLPDRVVYSLTYQFDSAWAAMGDVEWVHWSRLQQLNIVYNNGSNQILSLFNRDAWRVALGLNYKFNDCLKFKAGLAYDESPVRTKYRIAQLPDADRYWIAVGLKYKVYKALSFDAAYAHLFFNKCSIQESATAGGFTHTLYGNYKNSADLVGVQLTWSFV